MLAKTKPAATPKLVKINAAGRRISAKATEFAAVLNTKTGVMAAVGACPNAVTYAEAEAHIADLNAKRYGGFSDWRLPTVLELVGMVDYTRYSPAMDSDFYTDVRSSYYWTSTPTAWSTSCVFAVSFHGGSVYGSHRSDKCFVRPVRVARQ